MLLSVLAFACKISAVALIQNHNDKPQQCVQLSSNYSLMKRGTACSKSLAWFIPPPPILPPEKAFEFRVDCNALGSINCSSAQYYTLTIVRHSKGLVFE